ncbi:unnamed protein product [Schistosoma margrebowiei]|uniref:Uncharacterized protein n=1 Tax=Schistosoma margrebowiei TaxID=48269 RepID=A0A183MC24_9TREM|nr:unnamed protein product [Schistosoma margrebowiei]
MVASDQQLVHTSFVPSGSWRPCTLLVCKEGFPALLGGLSISTNPAKAPDIRFPSTRFRKQHPWIYQGIWGKLYITSHSTHIPLLWIFHGQLDKDNVEYVLNNN